MLPVSRTSPRQIVGYELNAFLSAARSVTFLLQKEFAAVAGFEARWIEEQRKLRNDEAGRFFLEFRNFLTETGSNLTFWNTETKRAMALHVCWHVAARSAIACCFEISI